jgi:hypothetical protein
MGRSAAKSGITDVAAISATGKPRNGNA